MSLPPIGTKVLTSEPMMAQVDGRNIAIFARAMCEVMAHDADGTMTLYVTEGDAMNYLSAAGGTMSGVRPEQVISRERAIAEA